MSNGEIGKTKEGFELSIVVAIIEGGSAAIKECLGSLEKGIGTVRLECIVPFDARLEGVSELTERFPWVRFVDSRSAVNAEEFGASSREHHDLLRAIGLRQAKAPIVALLEDHGTPTEGWISAVLRLHGESDAAAIGGAVENGVDRVLNWAVYYCDFGRYQSPADSEKVEYLSDSNVSYKREALWNVKDQWYEAFQETMVHGKIKSEGESLVLNEEMTVFQTRRDLKLLPALRERFVWGRSYGGTRVRDFPVSKRAIFALISLLLPFVLTVRIISRALKKKRFLARLILAIPLIFILETVWSAGEFVGYTTGRAAASKSSNDMVST